MSFLARTAGIIAITVLAAASSAACQGTPGSQSTSPTQGEGTTANSTTTGSVASSATASTTATAPTSATQSPTAAGSAVVMPFTGLSKPSGVAVGSDGAVYVTDSGNNRVVQLAATSYTQSVLGFTDLDAPSGISLDPNGNAFVSDATSTRWLWSRPRTGATPTPPWKAVSGVEWEGPFSGLQNPRGVIISGPADYVVDAGNNRVLQWQESSNAPKVVPFTGLNDPHGLAVSYYSGDAWVADTANNRVVRVQSGNRPTPVQIELSLTGLSGPQGVALDTSINSKTIVLYVTDTGNDRVLKVTIDDSANTTTQSILPFEGLKQPTGVTADQWGNVYVVDSGNNRVLKLEKAFTG